MSDGASPPEIVSAAPATATSFESDPRVSYDQIRRRWIYEPLAGSDEPVLEWEEVTQCWVPAPEDPAPPENTNKRKRADKDQGLQKKPKPEPKPRPVASVFITGLPPDATMQEVADVFGRYGVLLEDEPGKPRVKLYHDDRGVFKGEALVTYFKPESVDLAMTVLDRSPLRVGAIKPLMSVERAQFKETPVPAGQRSEVSAPKQRTEEEKRKIKDRNKRLNEKLNDWDSDDENIADPAGESNAVVTPAEAGGRTVVLKHMFTLSELEEDPALLLDLKTDVREECERITAAGAVTNVVIYDKEEEGILSVRFSTSAAAQACVDKMDGRWFDKRKVEAYITTAVRPKFRRSGVRGDVDEEEAAQEEKARTEAFGQWLEKHEGE